MKLTNLSKIACIFFALTLISSCANNSAGNQPYKTPQKSHQLADISQLSAREKADLYEAIIAADLAAANGEYDLATSYYLVAARLSKSIDLIQLSVQAAEESEDSLAILQAADMWLEIEPNNIDAIALKIVGTLALQDIEQAVAFTERFFKLQSDATKRAKRLDQMTLAQSLPVTNAYFLRLTEKYPQAISVIYARASFFARAAKHTQNPASILQQAFVQLEKALAIKDDFIIAVELKTRMLYQSRQDEKAEALLRKLHAEHPKSRDISQLLGQLLYDLRKYDLSKQHYLGWLKSDPDDTEARFFLAASYFATSNFEASLKQYQKILGSDYKPQLVYFFCGNSASQIKRYAQAIACYELVEQGKYLTRSKIELAKIYALTGKIDDALATVRNPRFATDENTQIQLINVEIEILDQHVDNQSARKRLNSALENYPNNVSLLFKKIKIEGLSDKPEQLVVLLQKAEAQITDPKKNHQFNLSVAGLLRNNNHYQQAVDWLNRALLKRPDDKDYLYSRALYKEPLGLFDEMISDFKHLLSLDPQNVNIKNALGYTLVDVDQEIDYAAQLIEQAYQAMPNNAAVIDSKGWLAYKRGAFEQALNFLNKAFKISPSAEVATHIGEVYWAAGDKNKAKQSWQKAKSIDSENYLLLTTLEKYKIEL